MKFTLPDPTAKDLGDRFLAAVSRCAARCQMLFQLGNTLFQFRNSFIDIRSLRDQLFQLLFTFLQGKGELIRTPALGRVHIQHLLDVLQTESEATASQDDLQPSAILSGIYTCRAFPRRIYKALVLIEAYGTRGDTEFFSEFRDRKADPAVFVNFCSGIHFMSGVPILSYRQTIVDVYVNVNL